MATAYESIGRGYILTLQPDARIGAMITLQVWS
jgi:hypothetical protein